ncbi:MAG: prephenate dehydratase [Pirellulales bacterium]|nr:prephenate dehydratase [Pirellulales bacterium]
MAKAKPKKQKAPATAKKAAPSAKPVKPSAKPVKPSAKPVKRKGVAPRPTAEDLQAQIGQVDAELLKLLQERAKLVLKMARKSGEKALQGAGTGLDDEALSQIIGRCRGPLPRRSARAVFRELLSGCRSLVRGLRVAFLGPQYSYSHLAALRRFGQSVEFVPVGSIPAVFEEVNRGHSDFGLVPVENSTDGRIADTLDMFTRLPVRICGEVEMEIHHTLLGRCSRTDVREVYSRPQALSQCRNWLAKHLPSARTIEVTSTSTAAQLAKEKPGAAAIASLEAGVHHGLDVLAESIEDNPSNTTRFAVIGGGPSAATGNDRTAILFQVEHRPGALAEAMNIFKRSEVNLTWIESFPIPDSKRAYLFFVEMEGHETDARLRRAVAALKRKALRLEILGSFPASATED